MTTVALLSFPKKAALAGLLVFFAALAFSSMFYKTYTFDEAGHERYGRKILLQGDPANTEPIDYSKMPVSALNALPIALKQALSSLFPLPPTIAEALESLRALRTVTILAAVLLGFYVFKWSSELYGPYGGFCSLLLYILCPNILAHGRLVTNDLFLAALITLALYYFWKFLTAGGWRYRALSALFLGAAQLAKYTALSLYVVFLGLVLLRYLSKLRAASATEIKGMALRFAKEILFFAAVSVLVINTGFVFQKTMTPLGAYSFQSTAFQKIQTGLGFLQNVPVPLPYAYLEGLDGVYASSLAGTESGNLYLLGEIQEAGTPGFRGFKWYFPVVFFYKVPLATQALLLAALILFFRERKKDWLCSDELFLIFPPLFFFLNLTFLSKSHYGVRYILMVLVMVHIFSGRVARGWKDYSIKMKGVILAALAYLAVSTLSYYPHFIPYFNELVGDRKKAYRILADSNLDWGQNTYYVLEYMRTHPGTIPRPPGPMPGRILVSANDVAGVFDKERFRWLRENFEPVDHVGYSHLVYEITPQELVRALRG